MGGGPSADRAVQVRGGGGRGLGRHSTGPPKPQTGKTLHCPHGSPLPPPHTPHTHVRTRTHTHTHTHTCAHMRTCPTTMTTTTPPLHLCCSVDEALLTGESRAVAKGPGDRVTGGTVNYEGPVTVKATATGRDSTLAGREG